MAIMSYRDDYKPEFIADIMSTLEKTGWNFSHFDTKIEMNHPAGTGIGIQSMLFERTIDGKTEYAYVYAGTNSLEDCVEDLTQFIGFSTEYARAIENACILSKELGNNELTFIGHSMGGGNATAASLITGRSAITFNPAGLGLGTIIAYDLPLRGGDIDNYITGSNIMGYTMIVDPLTAIQDRFGMISYGNRYVLPINPANLHGIDPFLDFFKNSSK